MADATKMNYCVDQSVKFADSASITSLVIYEDVLGEQFKFDKTSSVEANKASIDSDGLHLVMGYTKIAVSGVDDGPMYLEPVKVEYDKQIYKPGEVKVHMSIMGGKPQDYAKNIKQLFLSKKCQVSLVSVNADKKSYHYIAKWYYVHSVSMSRNGNSSSEVTLMCYSPDKRLTLDKYSKVYSGMRLGQDILVGTLTDTYGFKRDSAPSDGTKDHFCCNLDDLVYLGFDSNCEHKLANADEMLQPYLVQYNESFYDFACRVANRCGEFFYYEDGTLRLGLPEETRKIVSATNYNILKDTAREVKVGDIHPVKVTYPEINVGYDLGTKTEIFHYNSSRQDKSTEESRLTNDMNKGKLSGYTVDSNEAAKADSKYYCPTIGADEPLYCYFMGDIPDIDWNFKGYTVISAVSQYATAGGLVVALGLMGWDLFSKWMGSREDVSTWFGFNKLFSKRRLQKEAFENLLYKDKDGNIDVKKNLTMMKSIYDNLCSKFYEGMEREEDKVTRETITMDFNSNTPDVKLGSAVDLKDGVYMAYIVTSMKGEFTRDTRKHVVEAVPAIDKPAASLLGRTDAKALLLPPNAVPHIREVSSQEAVVKENLDPLELGRVRVKYLWQPDTKAKEESDADKAKTKEQVDNLMAQWKLTKEYTSLSEDARDAKEATKRKEVEADLKSVDTLKNSQGLSPWIRMVTPFSSGAKGLGGMLMTPDLDSHVMINYFDSNMEKPYVDGALYCRDHKAPGYKWEYEGSLPFTTSFFPTNTPRVISSAAGHHITFFDEADLDFVANHLLPPFQLLKPFGFNALPTNGGGMELSDTSGFYSIKMNSRKRSVDINSPLGTVSLNAFTGITINAPNGDINLVGKNVNITAGNNITMTAGTNVMPVDIPLGDYCKQGLGAFAQAVGTMSVGIGGAVLATYPFLNGLNLTGFLDLNFLRNLWEVVMRPVEGTFAISTMRNITMKAGKGQPIIPSSLLRNAQEAPSWKEFESAGSAFGGQKSQERVNVKIPTDFVKATNLLKELKAEIDAYYKYVANQVKVLADNVQDVQEARTAAKNFFSDDYLNQHPQKNNYALFEEIRSQDKDLEYDENTMVDPIDDEIDKTMVRLYCNAYNQARATYNDLEEFTQAQTLADHLNEIVKRHKFVEKGNIYDSKYSLTDLTPGDLSTDGVFTPIHDWKCDKLYFVSKNTTDTIKAVFFAIISKLKEKKVFDFTDINEAGITKENVVKNWDVFIKKLKVYVPPVTLGNELLKAGSAVLMNGVLHADSIKKLFNINGAAGYRAMADVTSGGSILMSNDAGTTLRLTPDGKTFQPFRNPNIEYLKDYLDMAFNPKDDYVDVTTL